MSERSVGSWIADYNAGWSFRTSDQTAGGENHACNIGAKPFLMDSRPRLIKEAIGRFPGCRNVSASITAGIYPNRRYGTAWDKLAYLSLPPNTKGWKINCYVTIRFLPHSFSIIFSYGVSLSNSPFSLANG